MQNQKRDIKVLISADLKGRFQQVIPKVAQLHAKNHFDFMLILGEVCHPRAAPFIHSIHNGLNILPLNIYFIDNSDFSLVLHQLHPQGMEIVPKLKYLGKKGLIEIQGLNIAFFNCNDQRTNFAQFQIEINEFLQTCKDKQIDILLTNVWPNQIKLISQKTSPKSTDYVSRIANQLNPRYHLSAGCDSFYRMPPYRNSKGHSTHFICVAPCEEELKDKYLFAVTIKPNHLDIVHETDPNFLQNPYVKMIAQESQLQTSIQQKLATQGEKKVDRLKGAIILHFQGFPDWARKQDMSEFLQRWGQIAHLDYYKDKRGGRSGTVRFSQQSSTNQCLSDSGKFSFHSSRIKFQARTMQERQRVEECWFCKANSDTSLIVWQGRFVYLCLEKGPISRFHLQIIPYNHSESSSKLDAEEQEELKKVKTRLQNHFSSQSYQVISYERCLPLSQAVNHSVTHLLPIKNSQSLTRSFELLNKEDGLGFKEWQGQRRGSQYFLHLQIGDKSYIKEVQRKEKVQADFMRQLICQLLETPKLVNWKACQRTGQQLLAEMSSIVEQLKQAGLST